MKFQNRFFRLAAALAIVGIVATQIPSRTSIALAQDACTNAKTNGIFKNAGGVVLGAVVVALVAGAVSKDNKSASAVIVGSDSTGSVGIGAKSLYDVVDGKADDFSIVSGLMRTAEQVEIYRGNDPYTVFVPTNDALTKALGANAVASLQTTGKQAQVKQLLMSITVKGSYNLAALKDIANSGKTLETLSGQSVSMKLSGDKLTANDIEVFNNESPASNGYAIAVAGLVNHED